ncbi:MAG: family 43 glycosylhydrolase [Lachnospiraceae bacterium]|nr:family 43 glycosylhydrolase [Lachnospiraceae bacterium]
MKLYTEKTKNAFLACREAALRGDADYVIRETERSVSLDDTDETGRSLLHYAVEGGNEELVSYLVDTCQMDPLWADKELITPYDIAFAKRNSLPSVYEFLENRAGFPLDSCYRNPVCPSMHPDPSIVRVGEDFYMVNSSFVFFPGLPVSHSKDLVHWETIGFAFENPEWAEELLGPLDGGRGFWAPDISFIDGKFVIAATLRNNDGMPHPQTQALMWAERPEGPYSKPVIFNQDGIDPSLFVDDDGKKYMLVNRGGRLLPLSDDLSETAGQAVMIAYGAAGAIPEGPHLFKKDGYYYLLLAEGGTGKGHMESVLRAENLYGPYEKSPYGPLITQTDPAGALQCCGHADIVEGPDGRWFIVYLCSRFIDGKWGMLGRETCLDEVVWTPDGWPRLKHGRGPSYLAPLPYPLKAAKKADVPSAGREGAEFGQIFADNGKSMLSSISADAKSIIGGKYCGWFSPRLIDEKYIEIENDESAFITGSGRDLTERNPGSLLLQHQRDFKEKDTFRMKALSPEEGDEAGMTLYYDENSFIKFGLRQAAGGDEVFVSEYSDDRYVREETLSLRKLMQAGGIAEPFEPAGSAEAAGHAGAADEAYSDAITFTVETDGLRRTFFVNGRQVCSWDDVTGICSEGLRKGKRFTGACVGIFVFGRGTYYFEEKK